MFLCCPPRRVKLTLASVVSQPGMVLDDHPVVPQFGLMEEDPSIIPQPVLIVDAMSILQSMKKDINHADIDI